MMTIREQPLICAGCIALRQKYAAELRKEQHLARLAQVEQDKARAGRLAGAIERTIGRLEGAAAILRWQQDGQIASLTPELQTIVLADMARERTPP